MNVDRHGQAGTIAELPPYRAFLVVDMKDFSGSPGRHHAELTDAIPDILYQTFRRCGLSGRWDDARFRGSTGDGYYLGFRSAVLPFLLNPVLRELQEELQYRNKVGPVAGHDQPIRMRVSINVGPMTDSGHNSITDGSGAARIETHRLLDSPPVRDLLTRSSAITCVAAIISARVFEDAVLPGYAEDAPEFYVPAPVQVKNYHSQAYLRVPRPSGGLLTHGFTLPEADTRSVTAEPDRSPSQDAPLTGGVYGSAVAAREYTDQRRTKISTTVNDAQGPVNTGSGSQFNMPTGNDARPRRGKPRRRRDDQR